MPDTMNVASWTDLFRAIGLDDEKMHEWHRLFESRHPEGHRSFLEWLGLSDTEVARIRDEAR